jgi:hypothetical protein
MNEIVSQLIPIFLHSETKNILGNAFLHAIPKVYASGFGMILSGNSSYAITGILMIAGLTLLIVRGLWEILGSTLAHDILSPIFQTISGRIFRTVKDIQLGYGRVRSVSIFLTKHLSRQLHPLALSYCS